MCLGAIGAIREVFEENGLPMARVEGDVRAPEVCLLYVPDANPGDHVLIELGFAVEVLDPAEAAEALRLRRTATEEEQEVS
jgi:hydrogenase expression/formation protein HypC